MTTEIQPKKKTNSAVIDFQTFRKKKVEEETLVRGRKPLYVSHGQIDLQTAKGQDEKLSDFSERIARIRMSLDKINALMSDLKKLSAQNTRGRK